MNFNPYRKKSLGQIKPRKALGQHFLLDEKKANKIAELVNIQKEDIIIEVGAGAGSLTLALLKQEGRVIAYEKDARLWAFLKNRISDENLEIRQGDILKTKPEAWPKGYKLVGSLAYNIAVAVLEKFLWQTDNPPALCVLVLQREVAQKLVAQPPEMNVLAILVQAVANVELGDIIRPNSFYPRPAVESQIVKITPLNLTKKEKEELKEVLKLAKSCFLHRRKTILNCLRQSLKIPREDSAKAILDSSLNLLSRPQELSLKQWQKLFQNLPKNLF